MSGRKREGDHTDTVDVEATEAVEEINVPEETEEQRVSNRAYQEELNRLESIVSERARHDPVVKWLYSTLTGKQVRSS